MRSAVETARFITVAAGQIGDPLRVELIIVAAEGKRMTRRQLLSAALIMAAAIGLSNTADASNIQPFDRATFEEAQRNSQPVLVEVSAPWCPVCQAQKPIIEALAGNPAYEGLTVLEIDFDTQKDLMRTFNARTQSTLIMFRGTAETGRSVGDTDPARIEALVASGFEG